MDDFLKGSEEKIRELEDWIRKIAKKYFPFLGFPLGFYLLSYLQAVYSLAYYPSLYTLRNFLQNFIVLAFLIKLVQIGWGETYAKEKNLLRSNPPKDSRRVRGGKRR